MQKEQMPLFIIKDYWIRIYIDLGVTSSIVMLVFELVTRGIHWHYWVGVWILTLIGLLGINKNKFLSFYPGRIEYNKSSANYQETIVTKKSIDMARIDKVAIYKFVDFAVEEFSYDKNIGTFKKLILTAFSWILYLMDLICFAVLRLSGRIKSINLYVLIFLDSENGVFAGIPLAMLSDFERKNLEKYLRDELKLNLEDIEVRDRLLNINFM